MKNLFVTVALLSNVNAQDNNEPFGAALKYIPEEVAHNYNFIDPKKKWEPDHGLTADDFKP